MTHEGWYAIKQRNQTKPNQTKQITWFGVMFFYTPLHKKQFDFILICRHKQSILITDVQIFTSFKIEKTVFIKTR